MSFTTAALILGGAGLIGSVAGSAISSSATADAQAQQNLVNAQNAAKQSAQAFSNYLSSRGVNIQQILASNPDVASQFQSSGGGDFNQWIYDYLNANPTSPIWNQISAPTAGNGAANTTLPNYVQINGQPAQPALAAAATSIFSNQSAQAQLLKTWEGLRQGALQQTWATDQGVKDMFGTYENYVLQDFNNNATPEQKQTLTAQAQQAANPLAINPATITPQIAAANTAVGNLLNGTNLNQQLALLGGAQNANTQAAAYQTLLQQQQREGNQGINQAQLAGITNLLNQQAQGASSILNSQLTGAQGVLGAQQGAARGIDSATLTGLQNLLNTQTRGAGNIFDASVTGAGGLRTAQEGAANQFNASTLAQLANILGVQTAGAQDVFGAASAAANRLQGAQVGAAGGLQAAQIGAAQGVSQADLKGIANLLGISEQSANDIFGAQQKGAQDIYGAQLLSADTYQQAAQQALRQQLAAQQADRMRQGYVGGSSGNNLERARLMAEYLQSGAQARTAAGVTLQQALANAGVGLHQGLGTARTTSAQQQLQDAINLAAATGAANTGYAQTVGQAGVQQANSLGQAGLTQAQAIAAARAQQAQGQLTAAQQLAQALGLAGTGYAQNVGNAGITQAQAIAAAQAAAGQGNLQAGVDLARALGLADTTFADTSARAGTQSATTNAAAQEAAARAQLAANTQLATSNASILPANALIAQEQARQQNALAQLNLITQGQNAQVAAAGLPFQLGQAQAALNAAQQGGQYASIQALLNTLNGFSTNPASGPALTTSNPGSVLSGGQATGAAISALGSGLTSTASTQSLIDAINKIGASQGGANSLAGLGLGSSVFGGGGTGALTVSNTPALSFASAAAPVVDTTGFTICWIAREIYGELNPRWIAFRDWLLNHAGPAIRDFYRANGEAIAERIRGDVGARLLIRGHFDEILNGV